MKLGIRTKKPKTAPPFNNSIRHWHNPCLSKIRFRRPSRHTRPCRPTLRQPRPLARCRRTRRHRHHAVRLRQTGIGQNYRLDNIPCPYLPNAYINTAHGTRGLATAPICAAAIAAEILGLPHPLSQRLRTALHPNRAIIRAIVRQQPLLSDLRISL